MQFVFVNFTPFSWGGIRNIIMNTWSELLWSFSITIWWTFKIHKIFGLYFSSWICPTYSHIFNIISGIIITYITICLLVFWIINIFNFMFRFYTTPVIINIYYYIVRLSISVVKLGIMITTVKKYLFVLNRV